MSSSPRPAEPFLTSTTPTAARPPIIIMRLSLLALLLASLAFGADNKPLLNDNPRPSLTNPLALSATDLTLMQKGQSPYQIVLPDETPSPRIKEALQQTARLLQTAFAANGC